MPTFQYQAIRNNGQRTSGSIDASTRSEALKLLSRQGMQPLQLSTGESKPVLPSISLGSSTPDSPLSVRQITDFTEDLADLLDAGLQLDQALRVLSERQQNPRQQDIISQLRTQVREGSSFSKALKAADAGFDRTYCSLIEAGEISGTLPLVLRRQAEFLTVREELKAKVISALIYPCILIFFGIAMILIFVFVLAPRLIKLMERTGSDLPFLTRVLITVSQGGVNYWWLWLLILIGICGGLYAFLSTESGKLWWDQMQLKLPVVGEVLTLRSQVQLTHTLGTLIGNGIPMLTGLGLVTNAISNLYIRQHMLQVTDLVEQGANLSSALRRTHALPSEIIDMISVGEQTGKMDDSLAKITRRQERKLGTTMDRLTALLAPAFLIVISLVLGTIAYSVYVGIASTISGLQVR